MLFCSHTVKEGYVFFDTIEMKRKKLGEIWFLNKKEETRRFILRLFFLKCIQAQFCSFIEHIFSLSWDVGKIEFFLTQSSFFSSRTFSIEEEAMLVGGWEEIRTCLDSILFTGTIVREGVQIWEGVQFWERGCFSRND